MAAKRRRRRKDLNRMCEHGFSANDFKEAFAQAGAENQQDIALSRLCSGVPQKDDEGYAHLLEHPPTLEAMNRFFIALRDQLEIESAAEARRRKQLGPNGIAGVI